MTLYIKNNNNHRSGMIAGIAYYNVGLTFAYNGWTCDVQTDFAGCGRTLWVNSSSQQHLNEPDVGDCIIIYQTIGNIPQVVTHVVEVVGAGAVNFANRFPQEKLAQAILDRWPYTREMKILAVLKPSAFGARRPRPDDMQLRSGPHNNKLPTMQNIVGVSPDFPNGYVHQMPADGLTNCDQVRANLRRFQALYNVDSSFPV